MKGDINLKLNKKTTLGIIAAMGVYAMADYVSVVDVKSSGGITVTGGITESDLTEAIDTAKAELRAEMEAQELPIGTIALWGNLTLPTGWIEMAGQSISSYPELSAIYGSTLPNMRGKFARGWDNGEGIDEDSGRAILSSQPDQIQNITGTFRFVASSHLWSPYSNSQMTGSFFGTNPDNKTFADPNGTGGGGGTRDSDTINFDASRTVRAGEETRPVNVALMYIVKAE